MDDDKTVLKIREEQLNIAKKWIQTGEVKIYKESFKDEKTFTVPVLREELVIEKKVLDKSTNQGENEVPEVIRIILSEEDVEFTKHKVALEDVSIYKHQVQDVKHIEEILKREEAKVNFNSF